ncbi:MAG: molybdopterin-guanine dinucleotide biosynthesis protein A [Candidatus Azotimanducaceae bacterium]|jgi:molybdopterin-guanine dinucleotide biosynthesis protein A
MTEKVSAIILAGGQGTRMGHENKGLVSFNGRPLIQSAIDRISPQVDELIISANLNINEYQSLGYPVVVDGGDGDGDNESLGPLSGILSSSRSTKHPLILVVPCDMPFLPTDLVEKMTAGFESKAVSIFANNRLQPLVTIIKTEAIDSITSYLADGRRSVTGWLEEIDASVMNWQESNTSEDLAGDDRASEPIPELAEYAFNNINSLEELTAAEHRINNHL